MNARSPDHALEAYSVTVVSFEERYLLLERSASKAFAPLRWTGVGGRVELDEFDSLRGSALRELAEETGFVEDEIDNFALRRALLVAPVDGPLKFIVYCTARLRAWSRPECAEGTLHWMTRDEMPSIDIIEDTRQVLPALFEDQLRDATGDEPVRIGIARHLAGGACAPILWL